MTTPASSAPAAVPPLGGQESGGDYLIRSEEQLQVSTDRVLAGYARLEKFTVTETKTITVEVTREEVRLVHRTKDTPGTDQPAPANAADDSARWMVLSREEVVVTKRVVPVERVRLEVYPVAEQRQVTEQVRKEQIDSVPEIDGAVTQNSSRLS